MMHGLIKRQPGAIIFLFLALLFPLTSRGDGSEYPVGVRGGWSFDGGTHRFDEVDVFAGWNLPCRWDFYSDWYFRPALDISAGTISNQKAYGFVGALGPVVELGKGSFPLILEGGVSPTILSRYRFDNKDFGDRVQFTSHVGLQWKITEHVSLGLRFQHMSNGGLARPNPGVNIEMLSASYSF